MGKQSKKKKKRSQNVIDVIEIDYLFVCLFRCTWICMDICMPVGLYV